MLCSLTRLLCQAIRKQQMQEDNESAIKNMMRLNRHFIQRKLKLILSGWVETLSDMLIGCRKFVTGNKTFSGPKTETINIDDATEL